MEFEKKNFSDLHFSNDCKHFLYFQEYLKKFSCQKGTLLGEQQKKEFLYLKNQKNQEIQRLYDKIDNDLDKEFFVGKAQKILYGRFGLSENHKDHNPFQEFFRGIIDSLLIENYEFAIDVYNTNGKVFLDLFSYLLTWEGIKGLLVGLGESIENIFVGNAYEKGKSTVELGLIGGLGYFTYRGVQGYNRKRIMKLETSKIDLIPHLPEGKSMISRVSDDVISITNGRVSYSTTISKSLLHTVDEMKKSDDFLRKLGGNDYFNKELQKFSQDLGLKIPLTTNDIIDFGMNGALFSRNDLKEGGLNLTIKIPRDLNGAEKMHAKISGHTPSMMYNNHNGKHLRELSKHQSFISLYDTWLKDRGIKPNKFILKIPKLKKLKNYYLMENLEGYISLKRRLQKEYIKKNANFDKQYDLDDLTSSQIYFLSKELGVEYEASYTKERLPLLSGIEYQQIEEFFSYVNKKGLFHNDLNPDNIMVPSKTKSDRALYLIDFGSSNSVGNNLFGDSGDLGALPTILKPLLKN